MKRASLLVLGILIVGGGSASADRPGSRDSEPRVVAESVVEGVRRVNIEVPPRESRSMIGVILVCPDGTELPEQEFPLYGGVLTVPVSVCADGDATRAELAVTRRAPSSCGGRKLVEWFEADIPPLGRVGAAVGAAVKAPCACRWQSLPVLLALFGALPFALGYVSVAALLRRRRR